MQENGEDLGKLDELVDAYIKDEIGSIFKLEVNVQGHGLAVESHLDEGMDFLVSQFDLSKNELTEIFREACAEFTKSLASGLNKHSEKGEFKWVS